MTCCFFVSTLQEIPRRVPLSMGSGIKYNTAKYGDMCGGFCTFQPTNVQPTAVRCSRLQQFHGKCLHFRELVKELIKCRI